jgi:hypothetical protein
VRTTLLALGLASLLFSQPAAAEDLAGEVRAVYREGLRAGRWVEVELEKDSRRVLVQLPAPLSAEVGDRVAVHLLDPHLSRLAALHRGEPPLEQPGRVIAVLPRRPRAAAAPN